MNNLEQLNLTQYCENIKKLVNSDYRLVDPLNMDDDTFNYSCSGCSIEKSRCSSHHRCGMKHSTKNFGNNLYECANKKHFLALEFYSRSEPIACLILGPLTIVSEKGKKEKGLITLSKLCAVREYITDFTKLYNTSSYATHFFNISYDEAPSFDMTPKIESYSRYQISSERMLESLIASGDTEGAIGVATQLLQDIHTITDRDIHEVRARAHEILVIISRASISAGGDIPTCFSKNDSYAKLLRNAGSLDLIISHISEAIPFYTNFSLNLTTIKHPDIVMKATEYIKKHYADKITLLDVANYCSISTSYLSKILKEELGSTFTEYTNAIRIEKSKQMLLDSDYRILEIAIACGFDDQSYFTKVFKKTTGMNPCKYRDARGNLDIA